MSLSLTVRLLAVGPSKWYAPEQDACMLYIFLETKKIGPPLSNHRITHPMHIHSIPCANGHIGIAVHAELTKDVATRPRRSKRRSGLEMDAIVDWGADAIVTLINDGEFEGFDVISFEAAVKSCGMTWHHLPLVALDVPSGDAMNCWRSLSPQLHRVLERGGRVLLHSRHGNGRAGMIAALLLIERGRSVPRAIDAVRAVRPDAIETVEHNAWLATHAVDPRGKLLHASLLGGAMGDSLGADIEFMSFGDIRRRFPSGITDLPPHQGLRGAITDDTQMTLFTAEGIIYGFIRYHSREIVDAEGAIQHSLLRWYRTQCGEQQLDEHDAGLIVDPRLWVRRSPGMTCTSSLATIKNSLTPTDSEDTGNCWGSLLPSEKVKELIENDSKGCGTIMRVAPVALMLDRKPFHLALSTSALTHGHPTGQIAAAAWAQMLADVAHGEKLEESAREGVKDCDRLPNGDETVSAICAALEAERDGAAETVESLGGGWTAEEALSIALYACLCANGFEEGVRIAVTHGGDSDSTGAIAGNMLGLLHPDETLGHRWAESVECADIIARLARDHTSLRHDKNSVDRVSNHYYPN